MSKTLVVFTHKYPYEPPTEQFFHQELKYLKQKFNKIVLIPTSGEITKTNLYKIDDNVSVLQIKRNHKIFDFILGFILNTIGSKKYWLEIINMIKNKDSRMVHHLIELTASYVRSGFIEFRLKQSLIKVIDKDENILLYSYWLNNNSIIAADLKQYLLRKKKINVKAIARAHGQGDLYVKYRPQIKSINENIDRIYSISDNGKNFLLKNGLIDGIVEVKRLGVDKQQISDKKVQDFTIVSCSVLNINKRVDKIINSLSLLKEENITWIHFGDGELMQYIKDLGFKKISNNITWELRGRTPNEEILNFYALKRPAIFINVSAIEGIPVSIMEAMSCGIPVIATDVGATSEIVDHGENGFLLKEDFTEKELTKLIKYAYYNNYITEEMSKKAYNKWFSYFNAEANYDNFANSCYNLTEPINEEGNAFDDKK